MRNNKEYLTNKFSSLSFSQQTSNSKVNGTKLNLYKCVTQYNDYCETPQLRSCKEEIKQFIMQAKYKVLFLFGPSGCGKHIMVSNYLQKKQIQFYYRSENSERRVEYKNIENYQNQYQWDNKKQKNLRDIVRQSLSREQSIVFNTVQVFQDFPILNSEISHNQASAILQFKQQFFMKILQPISCKLIFILNSQIYNRYYIIPKDCPSCVMEISLKPYTITSVKSIIKNFFSKYPIFENQLQTKGNYKDIMDQIIQISAGDMRKVLLNIYKEVSFKKPIKKYQMDKQQKADHMLKIKNQQKFPLFHMLGKYLYAKRYDPLHKEKNRKFSKQELIRDDPPFYFDPVTLFNNSEVSLGTFVDLLFENYVNSIATIEDAKNISSLFSYLDSNFPFFITGKRIDSLSVQSQNIYIFLLTWGIILKNKSSSKVNSRFKSFKKSEERYIAYQICDKHELMKKYLSHFTISSMVRWGYIVRNTKPNKLYLISNIINRRNRINNLVQMKQFELANQQQQQQEQQCFQNQLTHSLNKFVKQYNSKKKKKQIEQQIQQHLLEQFDMQDDSDIEDQVQ